MAKLCGVRYIYGTDLLNYRVHVGEKFGVDFSFNAKTLDTVETIMEKTGGRGVDMVFECARSAETPGLACRVLRPAGRAILVGISGEAENVFPVDKARRKELTLKWCRRFRFNYPTAIHLVADGKVDLTSLITHVFPLERTREAFELVTNAEDNVLKAVVEQATSRREARANEVPKSHYD